MEALFSLLRNVSICGPLQKSRIRFAATPHLNAFLRFIVTVSLGYSFFMGVLKQIAEYLYLRKPDPDRPKTTFVKYMHGINRLSLLLFIVALIVLAIKLFLRK